MLNEQAALAWGRGMKSNLVGYVCRAKVHVGASRSAEIPAGSPVTVYEGDWAYCPAGARAEHQWEPVEPVTLADLKLIEVGRTREVAPRPPEARV
jgi:hypothetical protein